MLSRLIALTLLPLLLWQGRQVRKNTPRLPEPAGPRKGLAGSGPPLTLWVVGDSAAAGVGVTHQSSALSGQLVEALEQCYKVRWQCFAATGHCAADTAGILRGLPADNVDVMVCSVGVNDAVRFRTVRRWCIAIEAIHSLARERFDVRLLVFSQLPAMQDFPSLPAPLNRILGMHASLLNSALSAYAARNRNVLVIGPSGSDIADIMASDGFHPGKAGYRQWAQAIAESLRVHFSDKKQKNAGRVEPCSVTATNNQKGL